MTIYVTYYQSYEEIELMGAFHSEEDAEEAIKDYPDDSDYYRIEEVTLY